MAKKATPKAEPINPSDPINLPRAECPECGRQVAVRDGKFVNHWTGEMSHEPCDGAGVAAPE